jgi:DnaJ family protein C protein 27
MRSNTSVEHGYTQTTDVGHQEVTESEGRIWAGTKGFLYFETSALSGKNVTEMFHTLFTAVVTVEGRKPAMVNFDLKYTPEQVALVSRIRSCEGSHEILGLKKGCSREEINKSYRQLAILLHPDKNRAPGSGEAFREVTRALSGARKTPCSVVYAKQRSVVTWRPSWQHSLN